ncbi:hypothetical protein GCM10010270_79590 [Streptomyces violaceus]|nr:hypothetical protein GCM10010270_79590 [Streptomyces janthinus]
MLLGGLAVSLVLSTLPVLPLPGVAPTTAAAAAASVVDESTALEQAKASGEPVEVTTDRTEYSTTHANPDGTFLLTQSSTPQRVKQEDGSWKAVDPALERRPDGRIAPKRATDLVYR